mmetsp:Transcript_4694/g.14647  ORF Transcript_4694/g.14647 Transcript_4694/m.14647 type:complete len:342 (+) Transcript_4694:56-1081(+)
MVDSAAFYSEYYGHPIGLLSAVHGSLRSQGKDSIIFLVGDSSLDNKHWFSREEPAVNGYERILKPPSSKCDVAYHLNRALAERAPRRACVNAAVEATTLSDRSWGGLLAHDRFVRDNLTRDDVLVVSVGGNDIALAPVLCTCLNIVPLLCFQACCPAAVVDACACACPPDIYAGGSLDGGCCCCGLPGCLAGTLCGWPPGLGYFVDLFGNRVRAYVSRLVATTKPKLVVLCMIYYLDVRGRGSWADATLKLLGYDCAPSLLQHAIRLVYEFGTKRVRLPGTTVLPFPLFAVLDGSDARDYVERVEPSVVGGAKIANALADVILAATAVEQQPQPGAMDART